MPWLHGFRNLQPDTCSRTPAAGHQKVAPPKDEEVEAIARKVARKVLALVEERMPAMGVEQEPPSPMSAAYERAIQGELASIDSWTEKPSTSAARRARLRGSAE